MADVLNNILSGAIPMNLMLEWLSSNKSDVSELKVVENSEFPPYFLNYLKDKCSWLSDRAVKTEVTIDKPNSADFTSPNQKRIESQPERNSLQQVKAQGILKDASPNQLDNSSIKNKNKNNEKQIYLRESANKKVQILTLGCASYKQTRKDKNSKSTNLHNNKSATIKPNIYNCSAFPPVGSKENPNVFYVSSPRSSGSKKNGTDLNSFEAFPPLGAKVDDVKGRRRITPTPVQVVNSGSSKFGKSRFELPSNKIQSEVFQISQESFQDCRFDLQHERKLLKQTRDRLSKPPSDLEPRNEVKATEVKDCQEKSPPNLCIFPDPENISMLNEMSIFIDIYSFFLSNFLVPNITSELYFLFELITAKVSAKDESDGNDVFNSVHNCVYFAVSVLMKQNHLLYLLDNATLAALLEIPFLCKFSPQLFSCLQLRCEEIKNSSVALPSLTRVPFHLDDDSRSNFPDENSFICFKKQRDLFYELLRDWQEQPLDTVDTKSHDRFARKAKLLISLGPGTLNMYHLAKLFQSQLIASCMCFEVNEVYDEALSGMQKNFPEKFRKLQERFLTPSRVGGLVPPPSFYGIQSFFSELISATSSPLLNQHLMNIFTCKILEMNNVDILSDGELNSLGTLKEKYIFLLHTLRLLGKFLGYLHFLPYSSGQRIPIQMAQCHLELRKYEAPSLDLPHLLRKALKSNRIILTVPWIVEYLSMMDSLALHLEYVQESLRILTDIYRLNDAPMKDTHSILFLRLIIGWLFDVLHYPKKYHLLLQPISVQYSLEDCGKGLDTLEVIDKQLIHSCCPYLIEFKVLVYNFLNDMMYKREVRKITPFSTKQPGTSSVSSKQQLQSVLEENFFSLHPSSFKKTTDFVAERMASKVIGKVRSEVTNSKLNSVQEIVSLEQYKLIWASSDIISVKHQQVLKLLDATITGMYDDIRYKVRILTDSMYKDINNLLPALLPEDVNQSVIDMCSKISFRLAVNKITEWCDSNLLLDAMKSDIKSKILHVSKGESNTFSSKTIVTSHVISKVMSTITKIHCKSEKFNNDTLFPLCAEVANLVAEETPNVVKRTLVSLTVDLSIALVVCFPDDCYEELVEKLVQFWSNCPRNFVSEKLFLCSQNVRFLQTSKNFEISCGKFTFIVKCLLDNEVFTVKEVQTCLEDLNELDWNDTVLQETLQNFTFILSD